MKQTLFKINEALAQALTRQRLCESCGNDFTCGAGLRGCWCSEIKLSDETRAELKSRFKDCLCSDCLRTFAANDESKKAAALEQTL
jgi:hypothetical protein